jgi:hypothetical protein
VAVNLSFKKMHPPGMADFSLFFVHAFYFTFHSKCVLMPMKKWAKKGKFFGKDGRRIEEGGGRRKWPNSRCFEIEACGRRAVK